MFLGNRLLFSNTMSCCVLQFDVPDVLQREHVFSSHNGTTYVFVKNFIYELCILQGVLKQYEQSVSQL